QQMKIIQYFMPVMLLFVFNSFSAGLTFYFLLSNIISFTQQYVIKNYFINEEKLLKQIQENRKKPKKKSGFQSRLDEMLKQQQEAQKKRQKDGNQRRSNSDGNSTNDSKPSGSNKTNKKRKRK
ncbi:MAG: YidC/Oxa1 family membrane protein insertase, partial [Chitinophagales bacterium]